jgi:hypothetical protein
VDKKLRTLAEGCEWVKAWPSENPFLPEEYVSGTYFKEPTRWNASTALVLNPPPAEVARETSPQGSTWLKTGWSRQGSHRLLVAVSPQPVLESPHPWPQCGSGPMKAPTPCSGDAPSAGSMTFRGGHRLRRPTGSHWRTDRPRRPAACAPPMSTLTARIVRRASFQYSRAFRGPASGNLLIFLEE